MLRQDLIEKEKQKEEIIRRNAEQDLMAEVAVFRSLRNVVPEAAAAKIAREYPRSLLFNSGAAFQPLRRLRNDYSRPFQPGLRSPIEISRHANETDLIDVDPALFVKILLLDALLNCRFV